KKLKVENDSQHGGNRTMDVVEVRGELTSFSNVVQRCEKRGVFVEDGGIFVLLLMRHVVVVLKDKGMTLFPPVCFMHCCYFIVP
ncbi:hypothetical protein MKW92_029195, partial [Papaver armeniacum]